MSKAELEHVLVITGSIGVGKSTVAGILEELGAVVVSADELARDVVELGSPALQKIADTFGEDYLLDDRSLNRQRVAELVFGSTAELKRLEAILHPEISALSERRIAEAQVAGAKLVIYDCPLYFEAGLESRGFGAVLLVTSDRALAQSRVASRDQMSSEDFESRRQAQLIEDEKRQKSDYVIENNGTLEQLREKVVRIAPELFDR